MSIKEQLKLLVNEGEQVKNTCTKQSPSGRGELIVGEDYEKWIAKCIILLESESKLSKTLVTKFIKTSEDAVGNGYKYYDTMIGILKAFNDMDI